MSNLVHRRRRCARIILYTILCLEGSTPEDRLVAGLRLPSVASDGGLFCTAKGSYFVLWLSCLPAGQTRRMWMVRQGSSLTWMSIRIRLQGRKPRESNKLFDLFYRHRTLIRPIRSIRGKRRTAEDMNPAHPSYLYDSWLKWGEKRKYEVENGWALMYFLMGSR